MKLTFVKEKFNAFLNNYYRILAIIMAILVLTVGALTLLWPQYQQLRTKGFLERTEAEELLTERQNYLAEVKQMKSEHEKLSFRAWQSLEYVIPVESEIYLLFAQIESLAAENNIVLNSINISDTEAISNVAQTKTATPTPVTALVPSGIKAVSVNVNIQGLDSYEKFKQFLDNIERNIRLIDINSLGYSPDKSSYSLTFATYFLYEEPKK